MSIETSKLIAGTLVRVANTRGIHHTLQGKLGVLLIDIPHTPVIHGWNCKVLIDEKIYILKDYELIPVC
jgi:hypothetical protein